MLCTMIQWAARVLLLGAMVVAWSAPECVAQDRPLSDRSALEALSGQLEKDSTSAATGTTDTLVEPPADSSAAASPAKQTDTATAASSKPLEPIPDGNLSDAPAKIEPAGFKGVTPGVTTLEELKRVWGQPKESGKQDGLLTYRYSIEPFSHIEVSFAGQRVAAIVIRLEKTYPAKTVAQQLQLTDIRPVLVANELGEILGESFPERGVMFAFEPSKEPGKPSMHVQQIVLEPLSAEPFLLRAETSLTSRPTASLNDLDQAIKMAPQKARAHWLRARALAALGDPQAAVAAADRAVQLEDSNPRYLATHAQLLGEIGEHAKGIQQCEKAIQASENAPHVKARALCLKGDLVASGRNPDYRQALELHTQAIETADPLATSPHPAIRLAAKEVLIDAHLGVASDIAWGRWNNKALAVPKWLERAAAFAEETIANEGGTDDHRLRVFSRALAACVGAQGELDPTPWAEKATQTGRNMLQAAQDPVQKQRIAWDLATALYDAVQVYQLRDDTQHARQFGKQAVEYLETCRESMQDVPEHSYLLGRLYFRLGTLESVDNANHQSAITWFDKAVPLLEKPLPAQAEGDLGRHGKSFVSMGVSYWETNQREKALELTRHGADFMRRAVEQGSMKTAELAVPYGNLAAMYQALGDRKQASRFAALAKQAEKAVRTTPKTAQVDADATQRR